jgi:hypothetical protein
MATLTARVEDWLDQEVRGFWEAHGKGPSSGFRHVVEEWWTLQNLPALEFRDGVAGRRAAIRNGPDVWEVAMVAADYDGDLDRISEHFGGRLEREDLRQALDYAERFAAEVQGRIEENLRIERLLRSSSR